MKIFPLGPILLLLLRYSPYLTLPEGSSSILQGLPKRLYSKVHESGQCFLVLWCHSSVLDSISPYLSRSSFLSDRRFVLVHNSQEGTGGKYNSRLTVGSLDVSTICVT